MTRRRRSDGADQTVPDGGHTPMIADMTITSTSSYEMLSTVSCDGRPR